MNKNYYYVSGHTAHGYVNHILSNLKEIDKTVIVDHPVYSIKTDLFNYLINHFQEAKLEIILSPYGEQNIEGIILRDRSLAILSNNLDVKEIPHKHYFKLPFEWKDRSIIDKSKKNQKKYLHHAYESFAKALMTHDQLEKIYIDEMDFEKADYLIEQFINQLLINIPKRKDTTQTYRRFFGVIKPDASANVVPHLLQNTKKRVYLKGEAGNGKSFFMKSVARACEEYGLNLQLYHCSFDSNSIDMVIIPEKKVCIFDSTEPHEFFPEKKEDQLIDLYKETVTPGTTEKYSREISKITNVYKKEMNKGKQFLKEAMKWQEKIEEQVLPIDQVLMDQYKVNLLKKL